MAKPGRGSYAKAKERRERGPFLALPRSIVDSDEWAATSAYASRLLIDLFGQYRGANNGDLCAAYSVMKRRGWRSRGTLDRAVAELRERGWIEVARQGGRHKPTLYAITFLAIDDCDGKLDVNPTMTPSGAWRGRSCTPGGGQSTPYRGIGRVAHP